MTHLLQQLHADDAGFLVSSELVLVATIVVIGLIVGLAEVANGVNEELEDVGSAVGQINQSYVLKGSYGHKAWVAGCEFHDAADYCDGQFDISGHGTIGSEWFYGGGHRYAY